MARLPYRCAPNQAVICRGLDALRAELEVPTGFSDEVMVDARERAAICLLYTSDAADD